MEEMAASGDIYRVEPLSDGWQLRGRDSDGGPGAELLRYEDGSLYLGGAVLLDGLRGAGVEVPGDSGLLTFTFRTAEDTYSASVYCRTGVGGDSADSQETEDILDKVSDSDPAVFPKTEDLTPEEKAARYAFLQKLAVRSAARDRSSAAMAPIFPSGTSEPAGARTAGGRTPPGAPAF